VAEYSTARVSSLVATPTSITADGIASITLVATVRDARGSVSACVGGVVQQVGYAVRYLQGDGFRRSVHRNADMDDSR